MRILLCDDEPDKILESKTAILAGFTSAGLPSPEIVCRTGAPLKKAIVELFENVDGVLNGKSLRSGDFDDYDIIVVDNNLSQVAIAGARLTAEALVGYLRGFSNTPYIVSLNKNPDTDFDLRFLIGDYQSRADLAINTGHLANGALWSGAAAHADGGFCPSYWPMLLHAVDRRRKQVDLIRQQLDGCVLSSLKFPDGVVDRLSKHASGFLLGADGTEQGIHRVDVDLAIREITFREVFKSSGRSLPIKDDRDGLANRVGAEDIVARVIAGEIDTWMRRDIVGAQEVLVDIPHLLARLPILLGERAGDLNSWNDALASSSPLTVLDADLVDRQLGPCLYESPWWPRPTFWWPSLESNDELRRRMVQPDVLLGDFVYCEDTSRFAARVPDADGQAPQEFVTELEGGWNRRYVAKLQDHRYTPRSRFAA